MQDRHNHFKGGEAGALVVLFDRNAAPVVLDSHGTIGVNRHFDRIGKAGHHLVDAVINDLLDQVVETALVGSANIHTGTYTYSFKAFKNLNILLVIVAIPVAESVSSTVPIAASS